MTSLILPLLLSRTLQGDVVALNSFDFIFRFGQPSHRTAVVAEDPPYYLLLENDDRLLAENDDLIEKEHL